MKNNVAAAFAALLLLSIISGCARYETVDIDAKTQAYSRVLYDDDEEFTDTDEEEIEEEPSDEPKNQQPAKEKAVPEASADKDDRQPSEETLHRVASSSSASSPSAPKNITLFPSRASSRARSASSSKSSKTTKTSSYYKRGMESLAVWKTNSSSPSSSSSQVSSDNREHNYDYYHYVSDSNGTFSDKDLTYNAKRDYIDFGDSESSVVSVLGDPQIIEYNEEEMTKTLSYHDCIIIFKLDEYMERFVLTNITVPYQSYYVTERGIETESPSEDVISTYGQPDEILTIYAENIPKEDHQPDVGEEENQNEPQTESDTENDITNESETESELTEDTDTDDTSSENTEPERTISHYIYIYKGSTGILSFTIKDNLVYEIHYDIGQE